MTNEDIQRALDRLRKNATYHGDEAEDWTVDGDAETIRTCLKQAMVAQEMAEALDDIKNLTFILKQIYLNTGFDGIEEIATKAIAKWEEMIDE